MTILQYPPNIKGDTYIMFSPAIEKAAVDNVADSSGSTKTKNKQIKYDSTGNPIYLYHPGMLKSNSQLQWEDSDVGRASDAVFGEGGDILSNITNLFGGSVTDILTDVATGGKARDLLAKKRGKILDPKKSLFFRGVGLREHQFTFDFAPETAKSAEEVRQIILRLKRYSHPNIKLEGSYLTYPSTWLIAAKVHGKTLMEYKPSIITAVNTDLAPNQLNSPFEDGKPVHIKIEVSFKELEIVTGADFVGVKQGYGY